MNKFSFIFILFFLCINQINAQELHFENYSVNDGLPHSDVSAISQDSKGFIWIGTYNGLTKFDGYTYTVYRNDRKKPKSISNNRAISLLIDKNFIWVGTETAGINRYNIVKDEFESFKHIDDNPTSLSGNNIFSIARDNKNRLWVATNKGLNLIRNDDGPIEKIDALHFLDGQDRINNIISDQNLLWLCTTTGIIQFDTKNFTSKYFEFPKLPFLFNAYQSIKHLNNLFIASDIGLVKFNITTQTFEVIDNRPMLAV
jgi:ligand-binding sensor domain-containing protein